MRLEFVKAFAEITESVFTEVLGTKATTGKLLLAGAPDVEGTVVTSIDLSGDVLGRIILHMDMPTAAAMAGRMLGRNPSQPLVASCIAELTGMAIGRAVSWLNDKSCNIQISPPVITIDAELRKPSSEIETLVFPLETVCGKAILNVSLVDLNYSDAGMEG